MIMHRVAALLLLTLLISGVARADINVVVHPDSGVTQLSRNDLINIFMGRYRKLPSGITALPVDLTQKKGSFYEELVDKELAEINSYWARLVFSGQTSPPLQAGSPAEVADIVRNNRGAIGYLDAKHPTDGMRVVLTLTEQPGR